MSTVRFAISKDKSTNTTRIARGVMVTTQAPQSPLYTGTTKTAVDNVVAGTATLKQAVDNHNAARAAVKKTRAALAQATAAWDGSYDVLITDGENTCETDEDGAGLGLPVVGAQVRYPLLMPVSIDVTQNLAKGHVRIRVHRAPGLYGVSVQTSTDPTNPALWKELDGDGVVHVIPTPPPGMLWVRAAGRSATAKSDYTAPVSFLVR